MPDFLRFGIPSLDKLIGTHGESNYGIQVSWKDDQKTITDATGVCIIGPDGTGKSVFALHLASQYLADCLDERRSEKSRELPQIYYISTDLNHGKAQKIWNNFALNKPFNRMVPFEEVKYSGWLFRAEDIKSLPRFAALLRSSANPLAAHIRTHLDATTLQQLAEYAGTLPVPPQLSDNFIAGLNQLLKGPCLFNKDSFAQVKVSAHARRLIDTELRGNLLIGFNRVLLEDAYPKEIVKRSPRLQNDEIELTKYTPQTVVEYIQPQDPDPTPARKPAARFKQAEICFIDLAATTAGDDWGFVHRLLALTQKPGKDDPRHLVIIDAVEGFETYGGRLDAFGKTSSRRARIAQLTRLAASKAHTLLIVEEMRTMQRLPEEFVADVVIRLRNVEVNNYLRRTVEIEKARGQSLIRGQHPFSIRKGTGSTTGSQVNADDPEVLVSNAEPLEPEEPAAGTEGVPSDPPAQTATEREAHYHDYVQVFPTLNYLNRGIMELAHAPREMHPKNQFAAFGIRYLDNMLGGEGFENEPWNEANDHTDSRGLPCGTVTALIGDSLTQKTHLGRAFLSRCFHPFTYPAFLNGLGDLTDDKSFRNNQTFERIRELKRKRVSGKDQDRFEREALHQDLRRLKNDIANHGAAKELLKRCGLAVLFTTQDTHHEALAKDFLDRGLGLSLKEDTDEKLVAEALIESRTICRRMEIHDVPASLLAHIFEQNIREAQKRLLGSNPLSNHTETFKASKRIRVVVDDFSAFRNTYYEVREDPLFLPYLPFFLGREGVTALIIDTQSLGRPDLTLTERYESELRELVQFRLYTWRVSFYGDNRVAITAIPPFSPATSGAIRELRWESIEDNDGSQNASRSLDVNPHFELYGGLEQGKLQPVPIEIRFYAESEAFKRYLKAEEVTFAELFVPFKREGQTTEAKVLFYYGADQYTDMRDFCSLQRGTRLDHTLVFQLDEFWTLRRPKSGRAGALRSQWDYLNTPTWERDAGRDAVADPYAIFQPTIEEEKETEHYEKLKTKLKTRLHFYDQENLPYVKDYANKSLKQDLDRVPFSWDFGFLLCRNNAWKDAADLEIFRDRAVEERELMSKLWPKPKGETVTVGELWNSLTKAVPENCASLFGASDLKDPAGFADKLREDHSLLSRYLWGRMDRTAKALENYAGSSDDIKLLRDALLDELSPILKDPTLFEEERFKEVELTSDTRSLTKVEAQSEEDTIRLNRLLLKEAYPLQLSPVSSWFEFLAACKRVAELQSYKNPSVAHTFDFSVFSPESFPCLILEIWASEILKENSAQANELIETLSRRKTVPHADSNNQTKDPANNTPNQPDTSGQQENHETTLGVTKEERKKDSLLEWLQADVGKTLGECLNERYGDPENRNPNHGFCLDLYKTWLLLIETVDFSELIATPQKAEPELQPRQVSTSVIAARHWYKTACQFIESISEEELETNWVPVRLPGNFSTRGDWFLTVAGGSRSSRLADRAMDLLGSKRANIQRLDEGIGLPVRKLFDNSASDYHLRTRLIAYDQKQRTNLSYKDFLKTAEDRNENFYWLWRSSLSDYHHNTRIWHRWLNQMILWWYSLRLKYASSWTSSFEMYARLENLRGLSEDVNTQKIRCETLIDQFERLDTWKEFPKMVEDLVNSLRQVSVESD